MTDEQPINIIPLNRGKNDTEKAADYKERAGKIIGDLLTLMREAEREDFRIDFQFSRDSIGMPFCIGPVLTKRF
jgi:hypothetical protein